MVRKSFFEKLLKFRCPSCGATDNNKLGFKFEFNAANKDFTVVVRCRCGKVCKAISTTFDGLGSNEQDAAEDTFMSLLTK